MDSEVMAIIRGDSANGSEGTTGVVTVNPVPQNKHVPGPEG
jgi:hypothetical protein